MKEYDTGITSEVYTIKSQLKLIDIFNKIIKKKSTAVLNWILDLNIEKNSRIVVVGTYFTGIGIVKELSEYFEDILLIDIYPHLKEFIDSPIAKNINKVKRKHINFSTDLELIYSGDIIIDTTGFGGLTPEQLEKIEVKGFLIEDPTSESNDILIQNKNNTNSRLKNVKATNKAILKTKGINTKTSGTMTLTIRVLTNALNSALEKEGVLYSACDMRFFEDVIFKEKNIAKFLNIINKEAITVSTIKLFNCDELLNNQIKKIDSKIKIV